MEKPLKNKQTGKKIGKKCQVPIAGVCSVFLAMGTVYLLPAERFPHNGPKLAHSEATWFYLSTVPCFFPMSCFDQPLFLLIIPVQS